MKIGGKEINNWWLVGGGVGVVGAIYFYRKASENSSAASSSDSSSGDSSAIDPVTGLPYSEDNSVDPLTGMTYLQEAQEYGSVSAAEQAISSGSGYLDTGGGYDGLDSGYAYDETGTTTTTPTATTYTTNAQWAQAVQAGLVGLSYSSEDVAAALGLFFAQHPLSAAQANIIQIAEAEYGPPPQGTYQIIQQQGNPPPSGSVTVPNVVGGDLATAHTKLTSAGLTYKNDPTAAKPGDRRMVTKQSPTAGEKVSKGTYVDLTWVDRKIG